VGGDSGGGKTKGDAFGNAVLKNADMMNGNN
jgi:hypothetical protein